MFLTRISVNQPVFATMVMVARQAPIESTPDKMLVWSA